MTLIEIMVVMAIMALMVGMIMVGFGTSRQAEVMRAVNQVANVVRYGYDKARVSGTYYRLLVDMEKNQFSLQVGDDKMYLPATDRDGRILELDESKERDRDERDRRAAESYNRSIQAQAFGRADGDTGGVGDEADPYRPAAKAVPRRKPPMFEGFKEDNAISGLSDPIEFPDGIKIVYVRTADDLKPITEGQASVYFFPRGRTQQAYIHIEDSESDAKWTIKIAPLTGRVKIEEGHEELKLPDDPNDEEDELGRRRERRTL